MLPDSPWSFRGERVTCAWLSDMTATRVSPSMYKQLPGGVMRGHVSGITVSSRVRAFDLRDPACVDGLSPGFQRWACHRAWMPDVAATRVSASLWERCCHGGVRTMVHCGYHSSLSGARRDFRDPLCVDGLSPGFQR